MSLRTYLLVLLLIQKFIAVGDGLEVDSLINQIEVTNQTIDKCDLFNRIASTYLESDPNEALFYANKAFQLSLRNNYEDGLAESYMLQGKANEDLSKFELALNNLLSALIIQKSIGNDTKIAEINYLLGRICKTTGNYEKAAEYCFNALKINEEHQDYLSTASIYNTLGSIYKYIGDYDKSLEYYYKCREIQKDYRE